MSQRPEPGQRLDSRYRLERVERSTSTSTLWLATDLILDRAVAATLIPDQTPAQRDDLTARAARAGQVSDATWVRVLDIGSESTGETVTVWVISEWAEGPTLTAILRTEPMRGTAAIPVVLGCAHAVIAAQRMGARHGALQADDVLLPADGGPRLTGLELAAVLRPTARHDDVQGLGALLYAALTGRWPLAGWDGLPPPAKGDGLHPRQLRRRISRELDDITARALSGGYPSAQAFVRDLGALPVAPLRPSPLAPEERPYPAWRRWAWRIVPPLLVAGIGFAAWQIGSDLGRIPSPARAVAPRIPAAPPHGAGPQVVWHSPPRVRSFAPPRNVPEDPGSLGLVVDGDPSTEWQTGRDRTATAFPGGAHGTGLLLDLGRARTVRIADLLLSRPGADLEVRAGMSRPSRAGELPIVTTRQHVAAAERIRFGKAVKARYWLVWFTSLPRVGTGHRLGVAEIALLR